MHPGLAREPHWDVEGYVRDAQGRPVAATVLFTEIHEQPDWRGHGLAEANHKGHYHARLRPGDYDVRARFGNQYAQVKRLRGRSEKVTQDLNVSEIEPYSRAKDCTGDPEDPCSPEKSGRKSWERHRQDLNRLGEPSEQGDYIQIWILADYEEDLGRILMRGGNGAKMRSKSERTLKLGPAEVRRALDEATTAFRCSERWIAAACRDGSKHCPEDREQLQFWTSDFYHWTSWRYAYGMRGEPANYALALAAQPRLRFLALGCHSCAGARCSVEARWWEG
jgi:hypothetical protein